MSAREVYLASDPVNAEIAKDVLQGHGIPAHVRRQHLWGAAGELPANLYPGVWVNDEADYTTARQLMDDFERGSLVQGQPWTCPGCREPLDGQFQACWNCQTARPD